MRHCLIALLAVLPASACVSPPGPSEPYAFVGKWNCGGETYTFTDTTYNDGTETYPIRYVAQDRNNFTLMFANGYRLALGLVTETGMTWVSGSSGEQRNCRRL